MTDTKLAAALEGYGATTQPLTVPRAAPPSPQLPSSIGYDDLDTLRRLFSEHAPGARLTETRDEASGRVFVRAFWRARGEQLFDAYNAVLRDLVAQHPSSELAFWLSDDE